MPVALALLSPRPSGGKCANDDAGASNRALEWRGGLSLWRAVGQYSMAKRCIGLAVAKAADARDSLFVGRQFEALAVPCRNGLGFVLNGALILLACQRSTVSIQTAMPK
jgi:hypothetical protein